MMVYIRHEYLVPYNCVKKGLKKQLHKQVNINIQ